MQRNIWILFFVSSVLFGCSNQQEHDISERNKKTDQQILKERLPDAHKYVTSNEESLIANYVERRKWPMQKLDGGLRVWVYEKGKGLPIQDEESVKLKYTLELLSNVEVYSSEKDGIKTFEMGNNEVEKGLEVAISNLPRGSKAKVIIPSHLGYGLRGDGKNIPRKATLIYDIEILP